MSDDDDARWDDSRWLAAAAALSERARPLSRPNPAVAAIIVKGGIVLGRGWTQPGGRPHAEAMALDQAGEAARDATLYVTLEPCAHASRRGPCCTQLAIEAHLGRVVIGIEDPDPRTGGTGMARLRDAGVAVRIAEDEHCRRSLAGYVLSKRDDFPEVTLKLAVTADGFIARSDGSSKWITGEIARAHVHRERARAEAILVGGSTLRTDDPRLDVRLPGLEGRSPQRFVLTHRRAPDGWTAITNPEALGGRGLQHVFVEGGAATAEAFLSRGLVGRVLLYRAPVRFGEGVAAFAGSGMAPAGWDLAESRQLGSDTLEVYYPASTGEN